MTLGLTQSAYTVLVPLKGGASLAYHSRSGALAHWTAEERAVYEAIELRENADELVSQMANAGYIVQKGWDEFASLREEYNEARYGGDTATLTLAPTLACNFACDYCFQGLDKSPLTMDDRVQEAIVRMAESLLVRRKRLHIAWYGGEPLSRLNLITELSARLMRLAHERSAEYSAMIVTNGYGLTVDAARRLEGVAVDLAQVTLDGAESEHDQRRHLLGGKGTFQRIVDNLQAVVTATHLRLSVRVNVDRRNAAGIKQLLQALADAGLGGRKNLSVYFAPVEAVTTDCHQVASATLAKSEYAGLEHELYRLAHALKLCALPYPRRFTGICTAVRPTGFVIAPNGDVHKCWDTIAQPDHAIGSVFDLEELRRAQRLSPWLHWSPFDNSVCSKCVLLPSCAGGCAHKFVNARTTFGEAAQLPCPSHKFALDRWLISMALEAGVITADDVIDVRSAMARQTIGFSMHRHEDMAARPPAPVMWLTQVAA